MEDTSDSLIFVFEDWDHEPSQRKAASSPHQDHCRRLRTYRPFTRPVRVQRFPACPRLRPDVRHQRPLPPVFVILSRDRTKTKTKTTARLMDP